jgi:lactate dehydrogenase-like 2-hydroxyacid dehydrogenase
VTGLFDAEIIALLPPSAKFICHVGAGYDNIDVEACTKRGKIELNLLERQWNETYIDLKEFPLPTPPISTFTL